MTITQTDRDLLDLPLFDRALIEKSRAENRPLYGHVAGLFCDYLARLAKEQPPKGAPARPGPTAPPPKPGLSARMGAACGRKAPDDAWQTFRDGIVRWVDGRTDTAPDTPGDFSTSGYKLGSVDHERACFGDTLPLTRGLASALHPDAAWNSGQANRLGKLLYMGFEGPRGPRIGPPGRITQCSDEDALIGLCRGAGAAIRNDGFTQGHERLSAAMPSLGLTLDRLGEVLGGDAMQLFRRMFRLFDPNVPSGARTVWYDIGITWDITGFPVFLERNAGRISDELRSQPEEPLGRVLQAAAHFQVLPAYRSLLMGAAADASVKRRRAVVSPLKAYPTEDLEAAVTAALETLTPAARARLLETLALRRPAEVRPLFEHWREIETAAKPKAVLERILARWALGEGDGRVGQAPPEDDAAPPREDDLTGYLAVDGTRVTLPPLPPEDPCPPLEDAALDLIRQASALYNQYCDEYRQKHDHDPTAGRIDEAAIENVRRKAMGQPLIEHPTKPEKTRSHDALFKVWLHFRERRGYRWDRILDHTRAFCEHPGVHWRHLVRLASTDTSHMELLEAEDWEWGELWRRIRAGLDVRLVALAVPGFLTPEHVGWVLRPWRPRTLADLDHPLVWAGFMLRLPDIRDALRTADRAMVRKRHRTDNAAQSVATALTMLEAFPKTPACMQPDLMRIALGPERAWRHRAQALLKDSRAATALIVEALGDGQADMRVEAAHWLGRRGDASVLPALEAALAKEKTPAGRAALMQAMRVLGGDLGRWLAPAALTREAETALKTLRLDAVHWLLPELPGDLAWRDGTPLPESVLQYWVALAVKLKAPGGNPLFDLWLDQMRPEDAARLGLTIFRQWTARDLSPKGEVIARADVAAMDPRDVRRRSLPHFPSWDAYRGSSPAEQGEALAKALAADPIGAADSKGVLGLCARAPGRDIAVLARAYLKKHGERANQAKAVLEAVAAIPDPATIQVIVGAADRLPQKSVRARAGELVEDIAGRQGWTAEELADRTLPTAGFDASGQQALDCGNGRTYGLRLDDDAAVQVLNPEGKAVKALPAPAGDEAEQAKGKAARSALTAIRKEVKQTADQVSHRLFGALCQDRMWPWDLWADVLNAHPIAGRLCRRLVWVGMDAAGHPVAAFRPLADGTLTDVQDQQVDPQGFASVRLAHAGGLSAEQVTAWMAHLRDYDVAPLFDQFPPAVALSEADRAATALQDRRGWLIDTFTLRAQAKRHGYERGPIGDGGGFETYVKRVPGAGLVADLTFSGSQVPEERQTCALLGLTVRRADDDGHGRPVRLGDVPPALLATLRADFIAIGDAGSGFAEDFETYER
ncbi:DUF4132 domain-containing protein [Rhodospira trueperi]|uniref:DUF4132 domain-containing protein n=1 Tax=Rhodospira trueperi TaxID=69960 RepID=A0A1G7FQ18_9PROT|nr:DUF4132 domain-containing protein [Rhodospira trueperi]SDE78030.1 protein of unknown function [Rhodospira trueperi]